MALSKVLNFTAIRKSVKKFEKTTGVNSHVESCIRLLIPTCSSTSTTSITVTGYACSAILGSEINILDISNDKGIKTMLEEVEKLFADRFDKGLD